MKKNKRYSEFNEAVAVSKEKDILLLQLLDSIEEPYNSVFTLRCLYGYEFDEIAKRYNKSESWARVTYHRARLKYQDIFKEVK